jgi:hypothetical protein
LPRRSKLSTTYFSQSLSAAFPHYRAGEFCTGRCFHLGLKVFRKLLKDGRFEAMMRQVIDEEKKAA